MARSRLEALECSFSYSGTIECKLLRFSNNMALECLRKTDAVTTGVSISRAFYDELDDLLRRELILFGDTPRSTEKVAVAPTWPESWHFSFIVACVIVVLFSCLLHLLRRLKVKMEKEAEEERRLRRQG